MLEAILTQRKINKKAKITVKFLVAAGIVALAVALPQLVHLVAGAEGGIKWLPMYLPVLLGGCLLGTWWGLGIGILSPVTSFLITFAAGNPMPIVQRLPFMICELAVFAAISGAFSKYIVKNIWLAFPAVLFAQVSGRLTFLTLAAIFQNVSALNVSIVWAQIQVGLLGMVLQALIVPLVVMAISKFTRKEEEK